MRQKTRESIRRKMSGSLACLLAAISVFTTSSTIPTLAADNSVKLSYKQEKQEKLGIFVEAENESFSAGEHVILNLYIQNSSGVPLRDGTLKWFDKKHTLTAGGFLFESESNAEVSDKATPDSAVYEELDPVFEESSNEASEGESDGSAPPKPSGPSSDTEDDLGTAWEEDWTGEEEESSSDGPYLDENGNLCGISLAPGEIFQVQFSGTIDEDIYGLKNKDLRFSFGARKPNGKRLSNNAKFQFNTGLMTMLPVEFEDGNLVETNEEHTMRLRLGLDDIEYMFDTVQKEKEDAATPSEAEKATSSEAQMATPSEIEEIEFTPAELVKPEAASPSEAKEIEDAEEATPSEAEEIEDAEEATPSEAEEIEDAEEEIDENHSNGIFKAENVKYTIETYGVKLKGVKARFDETAGGPAESVAEVSYRVASGTQPGLYFGKITASVKYNGGTYKTVQGFHINVTGEGQMELRGKLGDAEIIVAGEPSSFGAEEHEILSLQVNEISADKEELLSEAMKKKAEESGVAVEEMKAIDIKVIADGEVKELEGPVTVTFAGLELEALKLGDEEEPKTQKSLMEQAVALLSLEEETAQPANQSATETEQTTEVWHLDEDAVELNAMESYINEDGDVVMETDHFSIFLIVNTVESNITVKFQHATYLEQLKTQDGLVLEDKTSDSTQLKLGRETKLTEIYSPDEKVYGNGFKSEVQDLSKLYLANLERARQSYVLKEVWLQNGLDHPVLPTERDSSEDQSEKEKWDVYSIDDVKTISLTQDSTIRFIYEPRETTYNQAVTFYDYNVTNGAAENIAHNSHYSKGINSLEADNTLGFSNAGGINADKNYSGGKQGKLIKGKNNYIIQNDNPNGGNRLAVGIAQTPIMHTYLDVLVNGKRVNKGNPDENNVAVAVNGIVGDIGTPLTASGLPDFQVFEPGLFGNTEHTGKKVIEGYNLVFNQKGDTYTLSSVKNGSGNTVSSNLQRMQKIANTTWSNNFWPLDTLGNYTGKDPLFGGKTKYVGKFKGWYADNTGLKNGYTSSNYIGYLFPDNDDASQSDAQNRNANKGHNWFFGMNYRFDFELDDSYTGPLTFYFRGDDDFWLYVDGELRVDIGGIHSAIGATLNLRDEGVLDMSKKEHSIEIFYTERGGTGSCCYMEFTIPKAVPVIPDTTTTHISKSVKKHWEDDNNAAGTRPASVEVVLLQDEKEYRTGHLDAGNNWEYEWNYLPKYVDGGDSGTEYTYSVVEKSATGELISAGSYDTNYTLTTEQNKNGFDFYLTNTYHEKTSVTVTKKWAGDSENLNARPEGVTVYLKNGSKTEGTVTLSEENGWTYTWENLLKYTLTGEKISYTVEEAEADWMVTKANPNGWYVASQPTGTMETGFVVKNTYHPQTVARTVKKVWADQENLFGLRPETVSFQLKQEGDAYGNAVVLPQKGQQSEDVWEYTWEKLPKYYYTKTDGVITQHEYTYTIEEVQSYTNAEYYTPSTVTETEKDTAVTTITNTLKTAKFRVAKRIDNIHSEQLDYNDLAEDEFMITVAQTDGGFSTGFYLTHAGASDDNLESEKISAYIEVPVTDEGTSFVLDEVVPKEYQKADTFLTLVDKEGKSALKKDTVTIYDGSDVIVVVHNVFGHKDYFHSDASVDNKFDSDKIPDKYKEGYVNLAAIVPEQKQEDEDEREEA